MSQRDYLRYKALSEFYDGLSEADKKKLADNFPNKPADNRTKFFVGVGENVVGNAVYDILLAVGKRLLKKLV